MRIRTRCLQNRRQKKKEKRQMMESDHTELSLNKAQLNLSQKCMNLVLQQRSDFKMITG